jgi:hypothetical protein
MSIKMPARTITKRQVASSPSQKWDLNGSKRLQIRTAAAAITPGKYFPSNASFAEKETGHGAALGMIIAYQLSIGCPRIRDATAGTHRN